MHFIQVSQFDILVQWPCELNAMQPLKTCENRLNISKWKRLEGQYIPCMHVVYIGYYIYAIFFLWQIHNDMNICCQGQTDIAAPGGACLSQGPVETSMGRQVRVSITSPLSLCTFSWQGHCARHCHIVLSILHAFHLAAVCWGFKATQ